MPGETISVYKKNKKASLYTGEEAQNSQEWDYVFSNSQFPRPKLTLPA
jgi:hypothetical protein